MQIIKNGCFFSSTPSKNQFVCFRSWGSDLNHVMIIESHVKGCNPYNANRNKRILLFLGTKLICALHKGLLSLRWKVVRWIIGDGSSGCSFNELVFYYFVKVTSQNLEKFSEKVHRDFHKKYQHRVFKLIRSLLVVAFRYNAPTILKHFTLQTKGILFLVSTR